MIKYPSGMKKSVNNSSIKQTTSNRGLGLEKDINATNQYYLDLDIALIHKKPTPIQVVDVRYPNRSKAEITRAYYTKPSTTDYNGIYRNRAIDFEAKQTNSETSFVLALIHDHQIVHLQKVIKHGGIAFVIIRFSKFDETYYVEAQKIIDIYYGVKRSIPYRWFQENAHLIPFSLTPPIHYLKVVDLIYFEGE
ncbi:MAG: Holliday junction resolvase RecU [Erysipelothrix sp.]|nr:Holliday junction resolvase RecU [Erysipelothrix sp.]